MKRTLLSVAATAALAIAALAPAGAQTIPPGSYQQSCTNIRVRGDMLRATCNGPRGGAVRSTLDLSTCRRNGDIANSNGQLTCAMRRNGYGNGNNGYGNGNNGYGNGNNGYGNGNNGYGNGNNGYGNGNYGYGNGLPRGSYSSSCTNATMRGGVLYATCPSGNGTMINSSINPRSCNGADVANINGRLQCH